MVTSTTKIVDIFDAALEIHHFNRHEIINQLIKCWILENTDPDLHDDIKRTLT